MGRIERARKNGLKQEPDTHIDLDVKPAAKMAPLKSLVIEWAESEPLAEMGLGIILTARITSIAILMLK